MQQMQVSQLVYKVTRSILMCLCIALAIQATTALAQSAPSDKQSASAPVPLAQLADIIENDASRAKLVAELRNAAGQATQKQADKPLAPPPRNDTALAHAAPDTAEQAKASRQRTSFARRFAQSTAAWAQALGERVTATWTMITTMDDKRSPGPVFDSRVFFDAVVLFVLVAASTVGMFLLLRWLAGPLFSAIGRFSRKADTGAGVLVRRGGAILAGVGVDAGVVLLACGAGYLAAVYIFGETGTVNTRESLFINAFALVELTKVAIRAVFSARYENLRLLLIDGAIAAWWSKRLCVFVGVVGYVLLVAVPIVNAQLSFFLGALLSFVLMAGAYLYALGVIFKYRRLFTERLKRTADHASLEFFSVLYRLGARLWLILALAYFTTLFVASQFDPTNALPFMLAATGQTLVAAAIGFGLSGMLSRAIGKRMTFSEHVRERIPMLESRVNLYVPTAFKVLRVVILAVFVLVVASAWHLFDLGAWLASDVGFNTVSMFGRVAIASLVAALLWLLSASVIEHRLSPKTGNGAPSARQQTLLVLFRNTLAIVIVSITLMTVISQLGVDIGPLIAGAGVLGLAIGFGAQSLVQDIITGVFIQLENAMNTGDIVTVGGVTGTAERLTIRSVSIRDLDGTSHIVPFSSAKLVSNYMREWACWRNEYRVAHREDIDTAIVHMRKAFADLKADPDAGPNILADMTVPGVTALDESSIKIRIMIKTLPGAQWSVGRAFNRLVKIHFDRAGIEIPFPHQTLYFGENHDGTAPPANLRIIDTAPNADDYRRIKSRKRRDDTPPSETGDAPADV